jgi:Holliday junction resolvasome RuvABC endonuclease subunit
MKIIGIDLSLTSPALCYFKGEEFNLEQCEFFYMSKSKKLFGPRSPFYGTEMFDHISDMDRYVQISAWVFSCIDHITPDHIFIEDYAYASTGRVFNIAENCGILKYNLWKAGFSYTCIPPTVVKKTATGKGNSNKAAMEEAFLQQTGFNIRNHLQLSQSVSNPISDIIDSFYVVKAGLTYVKEK